MAVVFVFYTCLINASFSSHTALKVFSWPVYTLRCIIHQIAAALFLPRDPSYTGLSYNISAIPY